MENLFIGLKNWASKKTFLCCLLPRKERSFSISKIFLLFFLLSLNPFERGGVIVTIMAFDGDEKNEEDYLIDSFLSSLNSEDEKAEGFSFEKKRDLLEKKSEILAEKLYEGFLERVETKMKEAIKDDKEVKKDSYTIAKNYIKKLKAFLKGEEGKKKKGLEPEDLVERFFNEHMFEVAKKRGDKALIMSLNQETGASLRKLSKAQYRSYTGSQVLSFFSSTESGRNSNHNFQSHKLEKELKKIIEIKGKEEFEKRLKEKESEENREKIQRYIKYGAEIKPRYITEALAEEKYEFAKDFIRESRIELIKPEFDQIKKKRSFSFTSKKKQKYFPSVLLDFYTKKSNEHLNSENEDEKKRGFR